MVNKIVLTDVDGVLCNWEGGFNSFMQSKGFKMIENGELEYVIGNRFGIDRELGYSYVREFNNSKAIAELEPLRDAREWVKRIHDELGYKFYVCSSMSQKQQSMDMRTNYLKENFGDVFAGFKYLDTGADKDEALSAWKDSGYYWVEDKIANCVAGLEQGLRPVLIDHIYNQDATLTYPRVKNWQEIYQLLSSN
jgi:5'(3')-deoxyribonucleotidase